MRAHPPCIPCFVDLTLETARNLGLDEGTTRSLLNRTLDILRALDWSQPPPLTGRAVHRVLAEFAGTADPFLDAKIADTEAALAMLPGVEARVAAAAHPFTEALRFSLAGNIIDAGVGPGWDPDEAGGFEDRLPELPDPGPVRELERRIAEAGTVLFLADNAGEIVLDRPLLDLIGPDRLTVAVRGGPILNDATLDDALRSGLVERYRVVTNGSDVPGTWLEECSPEFVARFEDADLVVAKGQGNFETLHEVDRPMTFLFLVKCSALSRVLGLPLGTPVVRSNRG
jgi:damage-control phosphatase, subfamily I